MQHSATQKLEKYKIHLMSSYKKIYWEIFFTLVRFQDESNLYTLPAKIWNIYKAQWKHSYLTIWIPENGLAPIQNKHYDYNATLACSVMDEEFNLLCPELKLHNRIYRNVSFVNTSPKISHSVQAVHHCESMGILCVLNNSSLSSRKICDRLPDNNLEC